MAGINPFAGKKKDEQLELAILEEFDNPDVEQIMATPEPKPTAWQSLLGIVFGDGVAILPACPLNSTDRVSKRRLRRLRGRAKAERRAA